MNGFTFVLDGLLVLSSQMTGPVAEDGDGLTFETEAQKLGDAPKPNFKKSHVRLLFPGSPSSAMRHETKSK